MEISLQVSTQFRAGNFKRLEDEHHNHPFTKNTDIIIAMVEINPAASMFFFFKIWIIPALNLSEPLLRHSYKL